MADGPGLGAFSYDLGIPDILGNSDKVNFSMAFNSVAPITLSISAGEPEHDFVEGISGPTYFSGTIINNTSTTITGFHLHIDDLQNPEKKDVVFTSFDHTFSAGIPGFTLDPPSKDQPPPFTETGPRDLNFSGALKAGAAADGTSFNITMTDHPAYHDGYRFTLTLTPTVGVVPEPESYAMFLAGLGLLVLMTSVRKTV